MTDTVRKFWFDYFGIDQSVQDPGRVIMVKSERKDWLDISLVRVMDFSILSMTGKYYSDMLQYCGDREPSEALLLEFAEKRDFKWNAPDLIFYADRNTFRERTHSEADTEVRKLGMSDEKAFREMTDACPDKELEDSSVELDHTLIYGVFKQGKMVSRASAYAFMGDERVFDIGYVTHPDFKKKGYGSLCAGYVTAEILKMNRIAQIRVQPHLHGSIGIARKLGFTPVGKWLYDYQED